MLLNRGMGQGWRESVKARWARFLNTEGGLWDGGAVALVLGKGGDPVPRISDELEVERVKNLIGGFGWSISNTEVKTDKLILTIVKDRESTEAEPSPGPE